MKNGPRAILTAAATALAAAACGITGTDEDDLIGRFEWYELEGEPAEEFSEVVPAGRDILVLGEFGTPTACYRLTPSVQTSGSRIDLTITASPSSSQNCGDREGAYRYDGQIVWPEGTDELRVVHAVSGGSTTEHVHSLLDDES